MILKRLLVPSTAALTLVLLAGCQAPPSSRETALSGPMPAPAPRVETIPPAPLLPPTARIQGLPPEPPLYRPMVWVPGAWRWNGNEYVWQSGYYTEARATR